MSCLAHENSCKPFDMAEGPLFRVAMLSLGTEEHVLLLTFHHIIVDGWSKRRLFCEWSALYGAISEGKEVELPGIPPLHYADFSHWQQNALPDDEAAKKWHTGKRSWDSYLPWASHRSSFEGASHSTYLSKVVADSLKSLSKQAGSTLFMTMLAAFKALLYLETSCPIQIVCSPTANRSLETKDIVGYFVNPLALCTNVQGDFSFLELVRCVREVVLGAHDHRDIPFERILSELHPTRDLNIFPVWFNMLADLDKQDLDFGQGTTISKVRLAHEPMAMFDVTLSIRQAMDMDPCSLENDEASIGGLKLNLTYKADALAKRKWQNNYRSTKRCSFE